jgi:hemolysin activation/secretion protein
MESSMGKRTERQPATPAVDGDGGNRGEWSGRRWKRGPEYAAGAGLAAAARGLAAAALAALLALVSATQSAAQQNGSADAQLWRAELAGQGEAGSGVLPPLDLPPPRPADSFAGLGPEPLWGAQRFFVPAIHIRGNTVLPAQALQELVQPYTGRELGFEDLLRLRDELTLLYVNGGYVTSGAVLARERAADGSVELQVTEGVLREVHLAGLSHYRESALRRQLGAEAGRIVDVNALGERLRRLREDPRIQALDAQLVRGPVPGQADLRVTISEASPYRLSLGVDNHQSPAVGSWATRAESAHLNLLGFGDELRVWHARAQGLSRFGAQYEHPLGAGGAALGVRYQGSAARVVEEPFTDLEIESRSASYALDWRQPLVRRDAAELDLVAAAEYRRSKAYLLGSGFSFSKGLEDGVVELAVLQLGQELTLRSPRHVFAARALVRWGLGALGATRGTEPDGQFISWVGQLQWAQRLPFGATLLARTDLQLSSDSLPGIEQFAIGGYATVRGYRENRIARDNGWLASVELRVPLWSLPSSEPRLELRPFFDLGHSWYREGATLGPRTLASVGLGVRLRLRERVHAELSYARALRAVRDDQYEDDLQDRGLHLRLVSVFP